MNIRQYGTQHERIGKEKVRYPVAGWEAVVALKTKWRQLRCMERSPIQKDLFYGTLLVCLFLGSLSSVFRDDLTGKIVSIACVTILFAVAVWHYLSRHRSFP